MDLLSTEPWPCESAMAEEAAQPAQHPSEQAGQPATDVPPPRRVFMSLRGKASEKPQQLPAQPSQVLGHASEVEGKPTVEYVTTIEGTSITRLHMEEKKGPLVIPMASTRTARDGLGEAGAGTSQAAETMLGFEEKKEEFVPFDPTKYGLQLRKARTKVEVATGARRPSRDARTLPLEEMRPRTDASPTRAHFADEQDRFSYEMSQCPEEATLKDYEEIPVDLFGAALLRGMGWREGYSLGKHMDEGGLVKTVELKPRPPLLGLGAKHDPELQNRRARDRKGRADTLVQLR